MKKENIQLIKYFGLIFLAVVLSYKLPHNSYSISQYIIPPIKNDNSVTYFSGIITLILIIIGIRGLLRLERFEKINKFFFILLILILVMLFMKWTISFARISYHTIVNDGIHSIDIEESHISFESSGEPIIINVELKLKDYSKRPHRFRIRMYLPESLQEYMGMEYYDFNEYYQSNGNKYTINVNEKITARNEMNTLDELFYHTDWYYEDVIYKIYDENDSVSIIKHGL